MVYSAEQATIIYSDENILLVEAGAGTGKSTVLSGFSKQRFGEKILYLVYNRAMRAEAKHRFPINVEVHTVNSFGYKYMKDFLEGKVVINEYNTHFVFQHIKEISDLLENDRDEAIQKSISILAELNTFLNSNKKTEAFFNKFDDEINQFASLLYGMIENGNAPITHNVILKQFLDTYDFNKFEYDWVLLDEAQDINPIMLNIINKIKAKKVLVGDVNQAIYSFRNTINVFQEKSFKEAKRLKLTGSYRFGKNIATFVNLLMNKMFDSNISIKGMSTENGEIFMPNEIMPKGPYSAYITRTNAHLFDKAFDLISQNIKVSIPFDWDTLKVLLMDVYYLKNGLSHRITSRYIRAYRTFEMMEKTASLGGDIELSFLVKVIEKYNLTIPAKISDMQRSLTSPKNAEIILLTAHKSKGLEFYNVEIASDFPKIKQGNEEEKNLIYVATTRAMEKLKINNDIMSFLEY